MLADPKLVHREGKFYFVGLAAREVVFSVCADSLDDAWTLFRSSPQASTPVLSVIKTETEIYLA